MDLGRVRTFEWLTGLAGIALFVSLFLPWYGAEGFSGTATAWQAFGVVDFLLAFVALFAIALLIVTAMQRTAAVPQTVAAFVVWFAVVGVAAVLVRLINPPAVAGGDVATTREVGLWLGTLAAAGIFAAGWKSMRDKSFPRAMRPNLNVETIVTPTPDGERSDATR